MRLFGPRFREKPALEERLTARIIVRGDQVTLSSPSPDRLKKASQMFAEWMAAPYDEAPATRSPALHRRREQEPAGDFQGGVVTAGRCHNVCLKTRGQARYHRAVQDNDLTFIIGPAGTGKTYLAVAMAVEALRTKAVERIVLVRPAVEAGESLGYLPGTLRDKIEPYLAPLYDALFDILPRETIRGYFEEKAIEVSPLAYMRGRTLNSAFIILDEAQNATLSQMKMFLTRLGHGSKAIVAGDVTQVDLEAGRSGLLLIRGVLQGVEGISFVNLDDTDVVRHRLVKRIILAYEEYERKNGNGGKNQKA